MPLEQMGGLRRLAAGLLLAVMLPVGALADAIGTVDTDALVLRKSNSKESKALQTLSRGDTMDILSKSGSWYKVRYGKYTGYVMTQYVTVEGEIEEKEEKSSASSSAGMEGIESIADIGDAPATSRFGDSGSDVKKLQQALKLLNYYTGAIDGKYGSGTEEAVKKFQKSKGMSQDGIA